MKPLLPSALLLASCIKTQATPDDTGRLAEQSLEQAIDALENEVETLTPEIDENSHFAKKKAADVLYKAEAIQFRKNFEKGILPREVDLEMLKYIATYYYFYLEADMAYYIAQRLDAPELLSNLMFRQKDTKLINYVLGKSTSEDVLDAILSTNGLTSEILERIEELVYSGHLLTRLAHQENTTSQILESLFKKDPSDTDLHSAIAEHKNASKKLLWKVALKTTDEIVLWNIILNPNASADLLDNIAYRTDDILLWRDLFLHDNCSDETADYILERMTNEKSRERLGFTKPLSAKAADYIARKGREADLFYLQYDYETSVPFNKNYLTPKVFNPLDEYFNTWMEECVYEDISDETVTDPEVIQLMLNFNVFSETLDMMARRTTDLDVWRGVSMSPYVLPETLDYIAHQTDSSVVHGDILNNPDRWPSTAQYIQTHDSNFLK